ncbi:myb family transcription factor EFM-like isoform X2 [Magnolia sinica]|uniref:myb family transcription factor EFM-like isoform X2 n=1 Tax=Magnolia sinica TaxID=86752 RepID=UPI002657C763|nr:myb family transcription factor EFM-like isoform X2 [Magnolia sinica]
MGAVSSELSLDFKPCFVPKTISGFLREVSGIEDCKNRLSKFEEYVECLEEERRKIDAFKRELPLCMLLLNDAIEAVKEEEMRCRLSNVNADSKASPVLEEFMPIKSKLDEDADVKKEKDSREKMNWMSSAQLWSDCCINDHHSNGKVKPIDVKEKVEELDQSVNENGFLGTKYRANGGAFTPFKGLPSFPGSQRKEVEEVSPISDLSLLSPGIKNPNSELGASTLNSKSGSRSTLSPAMAAVASGQSNTQLQTPRKARRCWSPELHRRFVNALQQLGGSQVATPKQIRELMKVEGLTNDEVKSHLQKYRLHTRRLPASTLAGASQQVVVMGWAPHDNYQASKQSNSQSGSPQGPLQLAAATRGISTTGGDSGEDDEGKSESYSWKGHLHRSGEEETE